MTCANCGNHVTEDDGYEDGGEWFCDEDCAEEFWADD